MQISNFIICGFLSAIIYFLLLFIFKEFFNLDYYLVITFSYLFSSTFNFFYNKNITFKSSKNIDIEIIKFIIVLIISYFINLLIIYIFSSYLNLNLYISSVFAIAIIALFKYLSSKLFIYK
jgi:putative flippase GtrA